MEDGEWRMEDGGWGMEDGGWRMEDGGWRIDDGRWTTVVCRPWSAVWDACSENGRWRMDDGTKLQAVYGSIPSRGRVSAYRSQLQQPLRTYTQRSGLQSMAPCWKFWAMPR